MAPVKRGPTRPSAPSRRPATPPAQQRRNAAGTPTRRQAAEVDEAAFDPGTAPDDSDDTETDDDEELPGVIDLSGVEAATFEVIPKGLYQGYVESVEYGLSQSKDLPMLTWILKIPAAEIDPDDDSDKERTLRWYTTLAGDGAGRTKASLAKLDPDLDLSKLVPEEMDEHFGGMDVMIRVTIRPDRDDRKIKRNNVADVSPVEAEEE